MNIHLDQVSKRYGYQYILMDIQLDVKDKSIIGISGPNGSGKSTLLKLISGYLTPSEGMITYHLHGVEVSRDKVYRYCSIAAPYIDLINEYRLEELFDFHRKFKKLKVESFEHFYKILGYPYDVDLKWQEYSSGMQQRVKLALAVLSESQLLLLDEPTTYLDLKSKQWFHDLLDQYLSDRTTIICSNDAEDFKSCEQVLDISVWK